MKKFFKRNRKYKNYKNDEEKIKLNIKSSKKFVGRKEKSFKSKKITKIKFKYIFISILVFFILLLIFFFILKSKKHSLNINTFTEETYTETINNNKITYIKEDMIKIYNKYIKICNLRYFIGPE